MNPFIRDYTDEDREVVLNLFRMNVPTFFDEEEEKELIDYLINKRADYFVIKLNERIVGCGGINYSIDKTIGKISWDIIHPHYHNQGLGTTLLKHRLVILEENNAIKQVIVRTSQQAYRFYEKSGFKLVEIKKDFWAKGFDLYKMEYENSK